MLGTIWSGIKGVFGISSATSAGGTNVVMSVAREVVGFMDERNLTPEETMNNNTKLAEMFQGFIKASADENSIRSKTRRVMAMAIMGTFLFWFNFQIAALIGGYDYISDFIRGELSSNPFALMVGGVAAFFFGTHMLRAYKK